MGVPSLSRSWSLLCSWLHWCPVLAPTRLATLAPRGPPRPASPWRPLLCIQLRPPQRPGPHNPSAYGGSRLEGRWCLRLSMSHGAPLTHSPLRASPVTSPGAPLPWLHPPPAAPSWSVWRGPDAQSSSAPPASRGREAALARRKAPSTRHAGHVLASQADRCRQAPGVAPILILLCCVT